MKLRNLANKFLLVLVLALVLCSQFTLGTAPVNWRLSTAEAEETSRVALTKTYRYDSLNQNKPTGETIYEALGIKTYNNYLMALSATQDLNDVVIAVVDSGVDATQPVFNGRILTDYAKDFSQGLPTDTNNNWNQDQSGHGTHVTGIIADITLSNVQILPIRIFYGTENMTGDYSFYNAIRYLCALKNGESVSLLDNNGAESSASGVYFNADKKKFNIVAVNLSVGNQGYNPYSAKEMSNFKTAKDGYDKFDYKTYTQVHYMGYQDIVDNLINNDILPIVAAGNRSKTQYIEQQSDGTLVRKTKDDYNGDALIPYYSLPGACGGVLAVSAYDNQESEYMLAGFSYYNENISVAAPGSEIWSACSSNLSKKITDFTEFEIKGDKIYYPEYDILKDKDIFTDNYYYCSSGTSMATPFVTACYAMLMSDSSKTTAADYGVTFDAKNTEDAKFVNVERKALLAAAATDGAGSEGYDIKFGYGTVTVASFVPAEGTTTVAALEEITYHPLVNTTWRKASWGAIGDGVATEADWRAVCLIIAVVVLIIWLIKIVKNYTVRVVHRGHADETSEDDEQQ